VGRLVGVSSAAVSAVINGAQSQVRIAEATRQRILEAAAKLHYRPNAAAQALARRKMNSVGVTATLSHGFNLYAMEILSGIINAATRQGQNTSVFTVVDWIDGVRQLRTFCDGRVDGMILLGPDIPTTLIETLPDHVPFVALHPNSQLPGVCAVEIDEEDGACQAVRRLIALGHRRIMHVSGRRGGIAAERRIAGWMRAHDEAGISWEPDLLVAGAFTIGEGRRALSNWLDQARGEFPTAVFGGNDAIAIGCMSLLLDRGVRIPQDVSMLGFDDTICAQTTSPQLATVRQPLYDMAVRAVDLLLDQIATGETIATRMLQPAVPPVVFPVELVERASIGPARNWSIDVAQGSESGGG